MKFFKVITQLFFIGIILSLPILHATDEALGTNNQDIENDEHSVDDESINTKERYFPYHLANEKFAAILGDEDEDEDGYKRVILFSKNGKLYSFINEIDEAKKKKCDSMLILLSDLVFGNPISGVTAAPFLKYIEGFADDKLYILKDAKVECLPTNTPDNIPLEHNGIAQTETDNIEKPEVNDGL